MLLPVLAHAQNADIDATANSGAQSSAGAVSGSTALQGNTQAVIFEDSDNTQGSIRTVPDVFAPMAPATAPCRVGASLGAGVVGFGVSGGASWKDEECDIRNTAVTLHNIGQSAVAEIYLCQQLPAVANAFAQGGIACGSGGKTAANLTQTHAGQISWNPNRRPVSTAAAPPAQPVQPVQYATVAQPTQAEIEYRKEQDLLRKFAEIDARSN